MPTCKTVQVHLVNNSDIQVIIVRAAGFKEVSTYALLFAQESVQRITKIQTEIRGCLDRSRDLLDKARGYLRDARQAYSVSDWRVFFIC